MRVLERQFSQQTFLIFSLAYHILHVPYKWSTRLEAVQYCGEKRQKILFAFTVLLYLAYEFFCLWQFLGLLYNDDASPSDIANLAYLLCGNMLAMIILNHIGTSWHSLGTLLNASLNYYRSVKGMNYLETM